MLPAIVKFYFFIRHRLVVSRSLKIYSVISCYKLTSIACTLIWLDCDGSDTYLNNSWRYLCSAWLMWDPCLLVFSFTWSIGLVLIKSVVSFITGCQSKSISVVINGVTFSASIVLQKSSLSSSIFNWQSNSFITSSVSSLLISLSQESYQIFLISTLINFLVFSFINIQSFGISRIFDFRSSAVLSRLIAVLVIYYQTS